MQRNTFQRRIVLSAVHALCHATADEIYSYISRSHPKISKATVYRNLGTLSQNGMISHIHVPTGAGYFDSITSPHYHLQCKKCGKIFDVPCQYLGELNHITVNPGFSISGHTIIFNGICDQCNKKLQKQEENKKEQK